MDPDTVVVGETKLLACWLLCSPNSSKLNNARGGKDFGLQIV